MVPGVSICSAISVHAVAELRSACCLQRRASPIGSRGPNSARPSIRGGVAPGAGSATLLTVHSVTQHFSSQTVLSVQSRARISLLGGYTCNTYLRSVGMVVQQWVASLHEFKAGLGPTSMRTL